MKYLAVVAIFICLFSFAFLPVKAAEKNYINWVIPVRGRDFWRQGRDIKHITDLKDAFAGTDIPVAWLIHYDVLSDPQVMNEISSLPKNNEIGIFMEVTRRLATDSFVYYRWEKNPWTSADNLFLSGYRLSDRQKLIDRVFTRFKNAFGYYPASYGAWYVDGWSAQYIKNTYGAKVMLGLADQYSTDGYQVWGQPFDMPYFADPAHINEPAQDVSPDNILKLQWAPRHPFLSRGQTVASSNYSLQVNDYFRAQKLPHEYFQNTLKNLTTEVVGKSSSLILGVEVGELEKEFLPELKRQISDTRHLSAHPISRMYDLLDKNPGLTVIPATGSGEKFWWINTQNYRALVVQKDNVLYLDDLRFYGHHTFKDDDWISRDDRSNLYRLNPAEIDSLVLNNGQKLFPADSLKVEVNNDRIIFTNASDELVMTSSDSGFPGNSRPKTPKLELFKNSLRYFISKFLKFIPDIRYSSLEGQKYFGLRTGPESYIGFRTNPVKIGLFTFSYPLLDNFINLDRLRFPEFNYFGESELQILPYSDSKKYKIVAKSSSYGQDNILNESQGPKIYENSKYAVYSR